MDTKLIATLACAAALALGACSGGNPPAGPADAEDRTPEGDMDGNGDDDSGDSGSAELERLEREADAARTRAEIENARKAIADAVAEAQRAADANPNDLTAYDRLNNLIRFQRTQDEALDDALDSLAWFGRRTFARYELANGEAVTPREDTSKAVIVRIPRTIDRSATDSTQVKNTKENNPDADARTAFDADTFKTVMYEDGKELFSDVDVEFKVDGYTRMSFSTFGIEDNMHSGVKLTRDGLVIRTGGTKPSANSNIRSDFADMRRDITRQTDDTNNSGSVTVADGLPGQNGWDLEITFNAPQTPMPVPDAPDGKDWVASWQGNGDFYWKAIVPAAESQLDTDGDYYQSDAFNQPDGYKDLGTYEVWLSNHAGVNRNSEPTAGRTAACPVSGKIATSCPEDDEQFYLEYAAYGLFVYTADPETWKGAPGAQHNGQNGRAQSLSFGYSAFADENGKRTTDIGEAITGGKFKGQALAYAYKGTNANNEFKLLRGDATLTVTIPKTETVTATITGTLNNFKEWAGAGWKDYGTNFNVRLTSDAFSNAGVFSGSATATGGVALGSGGGFMGSFYGPRDKSTDLEVAGSWNVGADSPSDSNWDMVGSFGAKQRPTATPGS